MLFMPRAAQVVRLSALAILLEASLSFLGLGVQESTPAWGSKSRPLPGG